MKQLRKALQKRHFMPRTPSIERAVARVIEEEHQQSEASFWNELLVEEEQPEEEEQPVAAAEKRRRLTGKSKAKCRKKL
jgi:hypothetical protein